MVEADLEPAVSPLVLDVLGCLLVIGVAGHDDCALGDADVAAYFTAGNC